MIEDVVLGRAIVAIAECAFGIFVRLRVAGGPAVGPEVPEVEEFAGADGAHGIARIAGADVGVPLAFEEDGVA